MLTLLLWFGPFSLGERVGAKETSLESSLDKTHTAD